MAPPSVSSRPAGSTDFRAIAALLGDLGYPALPDEIPGRLERLQLGNQAAALVAVNESEAVGLLTVHLFSALHDPSPVAMVELGAFEIPDRRRTVIAIRSILFLCEIALFLCCTDDDYNFSE